MYIASSGRLIVSPSSPIVTLWFLPKKPSLASIRPLTKALDIYDSPFRFHHDTGVPAELYCTSPFTPSQSTVAPVADVLNGICPTSVLPSLMLEAFSL